MCYFGAGLNTANAALLFGVSEDTIARWQAIDQAPAYVWRTVLALAGELEAIDGRWRGWFMQKGKLYAPDLADGFEPNAIRGLPYLTGAVASYRAERDAARAAAAEARTAALDVEGFGLVGPMRPHRQEGFIPRLEGSAGAGSGLIETREAPANPAQPLRSAPLGSPAPSALLASLAPTGAHRSAFGRTKGSSTTLATLRAPRTDGGRSSGRSLGSGRSSGRHRSRSGIDAQDRMIPAAPEVFFQRQSDEAVQGKTQFSGLRDGAGVQVGRKTQQKGHGGTPGGDITSISATCEMISDRYQKPEADHPEEGAARTAEGSPSGRKKQRNQGIARGIGSRQPGEKDVDIRPGERDANICVVAVYRQAPRGPGEERAAGAARTLSASAPAAARASARSRQSRIIDKWTFAEDCISSPQDRSRFASFRALCYFGAGLNTENAALLFNVPKNTIENWQAIDQAPAYVWRTVLALAGQLEAIDRTWRGWFMQKGQLYAPDVADGFEPNTIRSLPMMQATIELHRQERARERSIARGEETPARSRGPQTRLDGEANGYGHQGEPRAGSAATAGEGEVREGGRSIRGKGLRAAPMQESPAPSVPLEDSHGWEPTGRGPELEELHQGAEGGSRDDRSESTTLATLGALHPRSGSRQGDSRASGRRNSRGHKAQDHTLIASTEVILKHERDEAIEGQIQIGRLSTGTSMQIRRKAKQIGHGETPNSDIKSTLENESMISDLYGEKRQRDQRQAAKKLDKPQQQSAGMLNLLGYRVKTLRGAAPLASSRLRTAPAVKSEKIQSRIIDIMLNAIRQSSVGSKESLSATAMNDRESPRVQ